MNKLPIIILLVASSFASAQNKKLFTVNKDSSEFKLTLEGASYLAALPLKCLQQQYPNKTSHTSLSDSDQLLTPQQLHPAFYGCFDWHSSVHGHWMLIRLLKLFPDLPEAAQIRAALNKNITAQNIIVEINYFKNPLAKTWERTYGWAWLLKLQQELMTWGDADAIKWKEALQPLVDTLTQIWINFLPKQTYANRTGVHPNTAFGLSFALDYARTAGNTFFEAAIIQSAKKLYSKDENAPAIWEPDGTDFFSPSLEEADLMRRVLSKHEFIAWFDHFYTTAGLKNIMQLPMVSDRSDYLIVHLDGLCFSRSWCMRGIAAELPVTDIRKKQLLAASSKFLNTSLPNVTSGGYGAEHWLASFAVWALAQ